MSEALMAHQIELERMFSKNQLMTRLRKEFECCEAFDFNEYLIEKEIPVRFGIDVLCQIALHRRADMKTMIGLLRHHFIDAQTVADMLLKCAYADLINWNVPLQVFIVQFTISDDVQAELDRFQFPLPMVVEPREVRTNLESGYFLNKGSIILRDNHHDDDVCLDHINRMNKVRFTINHNVANMVKNKWRNLDKRKEGETKADFERRKKAFEKYDRTAKDVMDFLQAESEAFHLTHKYDKRGRIYCQGYHVSYQGTPWNKAVIAFADEEMTDG